MPSRLEIRPTHKPINDYYAALAAYGRQKVKHEGAVRSAFQNLLDHYGRKVGWTLIPELSHKINGDSVVPDGTFRDEYYIERGYWEAKDTDDDLAQEIKKKTDKRYPLVNTIFEDTREARLYQNGKHEGSYDLSKAQQLCDLLTAFFCHTEPAHDNFDKAIEDFEQRVKDLAKGLVDLIAKSHETNTKFIKTFDEFYELCKSSLNPNLRREAVDEMLVQHLLTERLIRTIFDSQDFTRRNVIAAEVEKVIDALVSKAFNRHDYLKQLDRFYLAIEEAARTITSFSEKQHFLNVVYESFFQGYSVKVADTHGIVYTPQEIVDFMCASVEEVLKREFGKALGDKDVYILDPCVGTGNFIVNLINRMAKRDLPRMYREQLFANEVMLLPYYIAALNIEHAYYERTGQYEPFEGLCFVDSLNLAEDKQAGFSFMTEANTQRVDRQRRAPITVIVGNPPYNANQLNENDNNRNRAYEVVDHRVQATYARDSVATLKNKLYDPYIKFIRWACDRLEKREGIVCLVSNNSFVVDPPPFDGVRRHVQSDFQSVYHVDLHGNVRHNPRLSGTTHNVFGIQVGVGITLAVRKNKKAKCAIKYHRVPETWRKEEKLRWLSESQSVPNVDWISLQPDKHANWIVHKASGDFELLPPLGGKPSACFFVRSSTGAKSNRDEIVYDFSREVLLQRIGAFAESYNAEVDRFLRQSQAEKVEDIDEFVDSNKVVWSSTLKKHLQRGRYLQVSRSSLRWCLYRPFTKKHLYFDELANDRPGVFRLVFPTIEEERENLAIYCTNHTQSPFLVQAVNCIANEAAGGRAGTCFPFFLYDETGDNRRENVTDWALKLFREKYGDKRIGKWDIFHYIYGVLHHKGYREKFADCLKRELPRIPLAESREDFRAFADAGKKLAKLHVEYESLDPWPLEWIETPGVPLSYRVERMKLSKDKKTLIVNDALALGGIPPEVFDYRLGNRSALEWVVDQYRVKTDQRSGITSDPNRADDPEYIVRLVGQVVRVSVETVKIVTGLPKSYGGAPEVGD